MPEMPEAVRDFFTPQELQNRMEAYRRLHQGGAISAAQFNDFLAVFRFNDGVGHLWTIGATSGKWYRWDRTQWTQAEPPPSLTIANENLQKSGAWVITMPAASAGSPPGPKASSDGGSASVPANALQCTKCGQKSASGAFCSACGGKLEAVPRPAAAPAAAPLLQCTSCQQTYSSGKFCLACGGKLQAIAPQATVAKDARCLGCGGPLAAGAKFCSGCGRPASAAAPAPPPAPLRCPNPACGRPVPPNQKFCNGCGTPVRGAVQR
jgi:rRNA maturation endonuclease Nob1